MMDWLNANMSIQFHAEPAWEAVAILALKVLGVVSRAIA
jgi:hypothetical protein